MLQILLIATGVALVLVLILSLLGLAYLAYIATGCPDCNGDPERDAGYTEDEIQSMTAWRAHEAARARGSMSSSDDALDLCSRDWDRGSFRNSTHKPHTIHD